MKTCKALLLWAVLGLPIQLAAQTDSLPSGHITTSAQLVGIGPTRLLDTYLTPEHFRGTGFTFLSTVERHRPARRWSTVMQHEANFSKLHDRSDTSKELEGSYHFFWGKYRRWWLLDHRLLLQAGAMGTATVGFIYNTSNGNNPAQARLSLQAVPSARAAWRFSLWKRPMTVGYELDLPLAGLMFSPRYSQSYYEIFNRGNYDRNIVPTTFVSTPTFRQQLWLDVNVSSRLTLRAAYLGNYQQAAVNNLKQHVYNHRFMIGVVRRFQLFSYRP